MSDQTASPESVRVAERLKVWGSFHELIPERVDGLVVHDNVSPHFRVDLYDTGQIKARDVSHLWEQPCPECQGAGSGNQAGWDQDYKVMRSETVVCSTCDGKGTVFVPPSPGEVWEIGWREADGLPLVLADRAVRRDR